MQLTFRSRVLRPGLVLSRHPSSMRQTATSRTMNSRQLRETPRASNRNQRRPRWWFITSRFSTSALAAKP